MLLVAVECHYMLHMWCLLDRLPEDLHLVSVVDPQLSRFTVQASTSVPLLVVVRVHYH